jgi:hypothetical protein
MITQWDEKGGTQLQRTLWREEDLRDGLCRRFTDLVWSVQNGYTELRRRTDFLFRLVLGCPYPSTVRRRQRGCVTHIFALAAMRCAGLTGVTIPCKWGSKSGTHWATGSACWKKMQGAQL